VASANGDEARASEALDKLERAGCESSSTCVERWIEVARSEIAKGNTRRALALYKRAREIEPDNEEVLNQEAALSSRLGLHTQALSDYERLSQLHPDDAHWRAYVASEREAVLSNVVHMSP
jgi:tetratricopeptide (TPR) repeat protein